MQISISLTLDAAEVTLVNLSAHTSTFGPCARRLCTRFGYVKVAAMTPGTEAADTACKIARCWGINQKGIPAKDCMYRSSGRGLLSWTRLRGMGLDGFKSIENNK